MESSLLTVSSNLAGLNSFLFFKKGYDVIHLAVFSLPLAIQTKGG